jgi:hypothetical protein
VSAAEGAGDVEAVPGMGSGTTKRAATGSGADENDVGQDEIGGGFGGIAPGERGAVLSGERAKSGEEAVDPTLAFSCMEEIGRERKGEKGS